VITPEIPPNEAQRLARLHALALLDTGPEAALDSFTELAASLMRMPVALISLVAGERQWFKSAVGQPQGAQTGRDVSFCGHAILCDGVFEVEDARSDPRFADNPLVLGEPYVVHYAGAPLVMPRGERIGTLCLIDQRPGRLSDSERETLMRMARSIVNVLLLRENERVLAREKEMMQAITMAEFSPVGMFSADAAGNVLHANTQWHSLLRFADDAQGLGTSWSCAIHPDDMTEVAQGWARAVADRRMYDGVFRTHPERGPVRWIKFRTAPVGCDASGICFVGSMADMTERMELQAQLERKNRQLESILENLPCGLTVFDGELRNVATNQRLRRMLELPDALFDDPQVSFRDLSLFLARRGEYGLGLPEELMQANLAEALAGSFQPRERMRQNGTVLEVRAAPLPDGGFVSTYTDITAARQAAAALRTSQERLALALDASGLGLWEYDVPADAFYLSPATAQLLGHKASEMVLGVQEVASLLPAVDLHDFGAAFYPFLKGENKQLQIEHRIYSADGQVIWLLTEGRVTGRDAEGLATRAVGTCKDITARREADERLMAATQEAEAANRAKADFLATMSHEIRTPIHGVVGLARLLSEAQLPPREKGYVEMIDSCGKALLSLVDNILDFSKIDAGHLNLEDRATNLHALVGEMADVFAVRAQEKGIRFACEVAPQVPGWVRVDPHRLRQILFNFLVNALKFTASGGFSLRVGLHREPDGEQRLRFQVHDTGIGISARDQARLFMRFTQADPSTTRQYDGTGLGLAIAKQLAELMGGSVQLQSEPGVGSTFSVDIPLRPAAPREEPDPGLPRSAGTAQAAILLVEDNEVNQIVAQAVLEEIGYPEVWTAQNGLQALDACAGRRFDLILMDCQMPEMDGFQATRELRARGNTVPIIALTAGAVSGDREACLKAGMNDYLTKPFDPALLADKLARWLSVEPVQVVPAGQPVAMDLVFDPQAASERFLGNASLFQQAGRVFQRQSDQALQQIEASLDSGNWEAARRLAHLVRGSALTMGANRLAEHCRLIEFAPTQALPVPDWSAQARSALDGFMRESELIQTF